MRASEHYSFAFRWSFHHQHPHKCYLLLLIDTTKKSCEKLVSEASYSRLPAVCSLYSCSATRVCHFPRYNIKLHGTLAEAVLANFNSNTNEQKRIWCEEGTCRCITYCKIIFFSAAQQPKLGLGRLIVEVSRSHIIRHTHPVGLLWTSDQLDAEAATYTTHNRHKRRTSMTPEEFEPTIPANERPQTHTLDCTTTGICIVILYE
jgi:hypothetical protein